MASRYQGWRTSTFAPRTARDPMATSCPAATAASRRLKSSMGVERSASVMSRRAPCAASIPRRTA